MPSRIPVRISEREFPSLNQARLHYVGILRKYQPGQAVSQDDGRQVSELLPNSATAHSPEGVHEFRVVHGNYGRTCFANVDTEKNTRLISIMRSVKSFVDPAVLMAQAEPQISAMAVKSEVGMPEAVHCSGKTLAVLSAMPTPYSSTELRVPPSYPRLASGISGTLDTTARTELTEPDELPPA